MKWKKTLLALAICALLVLGITGCAQESEVVVDEVEVPVEIDGVVYDEETINALLNADPETVEVEVPIVIENITYDEEAILELLNPVEEEVEEIEVVVELLGDYKDYFLSESVDTVIDDSDLDYLIDSEIDFDGSDIDVKETLEVTSDVVLAYSIGYEDDFGANPYLSGITRDSIVYLYTFEDDVALVDIDDDDKLVVSFLGEDISIVSADVGEITYTGSNSHYMHTAESISVEDKVFTLVDVSSGAIVADVDGVVEIVTLSIQGTVNGLDIYVENVFARDTVEDSTAMINLGESSRVAVDSGDYYDDAEMWEWVITDDGTNLQSIGLSLNEKFNKLDVDSDELAALAVTECITLPSDYMRICFDSTNEPGYESLEVYFDEIDVNGTDTKVTAVTMSDDFIALDDEEFKTIYSDGTSIFYKDGSDYVTATGSVATIELSDADYLVTFGVLGQVLIEDEDAKVITIDADAANERLGAIESDAEASDVSYDGTDLGTEDGDKLSPFGVIISSPESNADNDEVAIELPTEKLELTIGFF